MRFLLINPFCPIAEGPTPPLGIAYVAAALEKAGMEVKIVDFVVNPYCEETLRSLLSDFQPGIVGLTAVTLTFNHAIKLVKFVKQTNPEILTVMGGPHVSFCWSDTLNAFPELDFIVLGEGEETIVELAKVVENGGEWNTIKSLVYRNGTEVLANEQRDFLDLDSLMVPARHLLPLGRYSALNTPINMITSRGCPFKCIFCVGRRMGGSKVRYRNPKKVVDEFEYLASLNYSQINIADDLFTAKKTHCLAICGEIIERKLEVRWSSFARVDTVSPELLEKMAEAGCHAVGFGVETANSRILKTIKKGITIPKVIAAINMCIDVGIEPHISFILGLPHETPATLKETIEFGEKIHSMGASYGYHLLAPFPGTAIREESQKYGINILSSDWSQYHANRAVTETAAVNKQILDEIAEKWDREVQRKLGAIEKRMKKGEASKDEAWQIINLNRFVFIYDLMMNSIIEKVGMWSKQNEPATVADALEILAEKVYRHTKSSKQESSDFLHYAYDKGTLEYVEEQHIVQWRWQDQLKLSA